MIKVEEEFRGAFSNVTFEIHLERWKNLGLHSSDWKFRIEKFKEAIQGLRKLEIYQLLIKFGDDSFGYVDNVMSGGVAHPHKKAQRRFVKLAFLALLSLYHIL